MKNTYKYLLIVLIMGIFAIPSFVMAETESNEAIVNLQSQDGQGIKVANVSYKIYEQLTDINNNYVYGKRINSGKIGTTGSKEITIKFKDEDVSKTVAVEYYIKSRDYERFVVWNHTINRGDQKNIILTLSSAQIILKNSSNHLLKDTKFDIYSTIKDVNNNAVANKRLYSNQKTGVTGGKTFYFVPGEYVLKIKYPDLKDADPVYNFFTINENQKTTVTYIFNSLKVTIYEENSVVNQNAYFKLYHKENYEYKYIGQFKTEKEGFKRLYLPIGDYKIEFKGRDNKYAEPMSFTIYRGSEKSITHNLGSFRLKVLDSDEDPLPYQKVSIYKYYDDKRHGKVFDGMTNVYGEVNVMLSTGYYSADIEGVYRGINYKLDMFSIDETRSNTIEYILSSAKVFVKDINDTNIKNRSFTLYYPAVDEKGLTIPGVKIGTFNTSNTGYAQIYLAPARYIAVLGGTDRMTPFLVKSYKINSVYLKTDDTPNNNDANYDDTIGDGSDDYFANYNSLYNLDSDYDKVSDFEELYLYGTDVFDKDTDDDGYDDGHEIRYGYDPNGPGRLSYEKFSYDKPRIKSLSREQKLAQSLKKSLESRLGVGNLHISSKNWHTVVNSYIYGGYTIDEIQNTIVYGPGQVHPSIQAVAWRNASNNQLASR